MKKFDLHIHTIQTDSDPVFDFSITALKEYVDNAGLDVIAITNHNCFDLEQFRVIQDEIGEHATVLPGIEISIGQKNGHFIVIADSSDVEDFSSRCALIERLIINNSDSISLAKFQELFPDLGRYILIPHYDKSPAVESCVVEDLKDHIICGEVSSVKKFIYCKKDEARLTPVYFSDWRPISGEEQPCRHTWIDVSDISVSAINYALSDKSKVQLSNEDGSQIFQVLPDVKLSTGLTVIMGGRSSGKTFTLNRIDNSYENVKYIKQFSLLEMDPEKSREEFTNKIAAKQSTAMKDYFQPFAKVVDEIVGISIEEDERLLDNYLSSLLKNATETDRADMFSKCSLYSESEYSIDNLDTLNELISAVQKLLEARQYKEIIEESISRESLVELHSNLIQKYVDEKQLSLKKTWVNDAIASIKRKLQRRTADTIIEDIDFYTIQMNRRKVSRFRELAETIKRPSIIKEQDIEGFKIQISKRPYANAGELKNQSGRVLAFKDVLNDYSQDPYTFLLKLSEKQEIESKDYYQFFAKVEYRILNQYGYEVSGGERAEFNLLQEINDANKFDMLLIDEPESSFDNIFLREHVNHIIKDLSTRMPVVIVTHNNTVGASIKPNFIIYTQREITGREVMFKIYYGPPDSKFLVSESGEQIPNIKATLDCLEAGEDAYDERRKDYEMLRN